ncbi:MAG: hypothetical protein AAF438_23665, partial [Pseudomonadota bacterium]
IVASIYCDMLKEHLPKFSTDKELTYPIPFFDMVPNPYAFIHEFISLFYVEDLVEKNTYKNLREQLDKNVAGITAKYGKKNADTIVFPEDLKKDHTPQQVMDMYFHGTSLTDAFTFNSSFTLPVSDRFKHQYVLGKTGSGKSVLLRGQIAQDINAGRGVVIITPEEGLLRDALSFVPPEREKDVVFFDPGSARNPIVGFNPFVGKVTKDELTLRAGELEIILIRALGDLGVKMRPIFTNTVYALLKTEGSFTDIPKLLYPDDNCFRQSIMHLLDERTADFFTKYDKSRYYKEAYEPVINRLDPLLRDPLAQTLALNTLDFSDLINKKSSIVLCNLSSLRGFMAEVVGQLLLATFQQTFFQRDHIPEKNRLPYFFYMDEFQTYATTNEQSLKDFLTRARKYKVGIVMAHQNTKDIPPGLLSSIFGNCGTLMGMLMSAEDARRFATESQLRNYNSSGDMDSAAQQLQNFKPGQVAVSTPDAELQAWPSGCFYSRKKTRKHSTCARVAPRP